jgi:hypothetical protein
MDNKLTFKEAILKDLDLGETVWNEYTAKAQHNPVYKKLIKEGLYSDVAGALGAIQDAVWAAAQPTLIGREIIKVIPTKNALERFPKEIRAYAWEGEGPAYDTGARLEMQDVKADKEINSKKEWTESFVEDASWDVLRWQIEAIGKAIGRYEAEKVIAAYNGIAAASLAGGAEKTITAGAPTWAQIVDLVEAVDAEDFSTTVVAMKPAEFGGLMKLDNFISSLYRSPSDMRNGVVYHTSLGVTFVRSSLLTKSLAIDINAAGVMLLRRDVNTKPYEDDGRGMYGVFGSERVGVGILRTKAVARGTN